MAHLQRKKLDKPDEVRPYLARRQTEIYACRHLRPRPWSEPLGSSVWRSGPGCTPERCEVVPLQRSRPGGPHRGAIMALAGTDEVLVSGTTCELLTGSGLAFESRGRHVLKGIAGDREVFALKEPTG
jgi:hypothetical protein